MIVYLDSSALVKLFIRESGTELVQRTVASSRVQATCELAYVEIRSALARREREGTLDRSDFSALLREFDEAWSGFFLIPVDRHLIQEAGDLAQGHRLRAYDAIHLAAGLRVAARTGKSVTFACFDRALATAAASLNLRGLGVE